MSVTKKIRIQNPSGSSSSSRDIGAEAQYVDVTRNAQGEIVTDLSQKQPTDTVESLSSTLKNIEDHMDDPIVLDDVPTQGSQNGVKSGGVYNAIQADSSLNTTSTKPVQNKVITNALNGKIDTYMTQPGRWDTTPTENSIKPVTSGGIYAALANAGKDDNFIGTVAEWNALTDTEKAQYRTYDLTDDFNGVEVDDALSLTSTNPVQNRIITAKINSLLSGSEILIDYDPNEMAGITITIYHEASAEGHTPESYTVTLDNTGEVEIDVKNLGDWTIAWTHEGQQYSENFRVEYFGLYHIILHEGFTWRQWVVAGGLPINKYNSLADLLANQEDIRRLCTIHAAVDYMCEFASVNNDLETIINTGLFAKWVNLRDYALDNMEANSAIKDAMDEAGLYGYGELVYEDDEWKPKGNVPVMTSDTAPYGEASAVSPHSSAPAYKAFDGDTSTHAAFTNAVNNYLRYKFANPVKAKKATIYQADNNKYVIKASNDGSTWDTVSAEFTGTGTAEEIEISLTTNNYYLQYELVETEKLNTGASYTSVTELQFYGRELKVSVPTMTSNTAPYGEASASVADSGYEAYKAFDGNNSTYWFKDGGVGQWVQYDFKRPVRLTQLYAMGYGVDNCFKDVEIYGVQNQNATKIADLTFENVASLQKKDVDSNVAYTGFRFKIVADHGTVINNAVKTLQFYGKDYSEKEFANDGSKWLYDHGVELEEFIYNTVGSGSVSEEANDEIYIEIPASSQRAASALASVDLTNHSILRAVAGEQWVATVELTVGPNARPSYASHGIEAYVDIAPPVSKNNLALSVASFNTSKYVGIYAGNNTGSAHCLGTISELWLE